MTTDLFDRLRAVWSYLEGEAMDGSEAHRRMADTVEETGETLEALLEAKNSHIEHYRTKLDFLERELAATRDKAARLSQQARDAVAAVGPGWFVSAETTLAEAIEMKTKALEAVATKAEAKGALEALERAEGRIDDELSGYGLARQNGPDNYDEARAEGRDEASLIVHEEAARWREVSRG